jgi:hypothetical protein
LTAVLLDPAQRIGQGAADRHHREVIGAQQLMRERMVGGQPRRAAAHEPTARPEFVGETTGVRPHGGVGDQSALHLTALGSEGGQAADHPV